MPWRIAGHLRSSPRMRTTKGGILDLNKMHQLMPALPFLHLYLFSSGTRTEPHRRFSDSIDFKHNFFFFFTALQVPVFHMTHDLHVLEEHDKRWI